MATYIFADLNVRDDFVTDSKNVLIYDTKVVVQSIWRLLTTEEGEIPNFRNYGLNVKQFMQYPLNDSTVRTIYNYVKDRVQAFETRAEVIKTQVDVDFEAGWLLMVFIIRIKATGELISLPTWTVQVSTA
jgi:phage baseplate assembly protein W